MDKNMEKKKTIITAAALGQLILVIAFTIYGAFSRTFTGRKSDLLVAASLLVFWALMDIAEPICLHRFQDITQQRKSAYLRFLALDLAGLAGLAYFIYCMGHTANNAIIGAVVYAVTINPKRKSQDVFYGLSDE